MLRQLFCIFYAACLSLLAAYAAPSPSVMFIPGHYNQLSNDNFTYAQIAADAQGNVYVPNIFSLLYRFNSASSQPVTFAGMRADGVALDKAGNLYIADNWYNRIRKVDSATGLITTVANVSSPRYIAVDAANNIYVTGYPLTVVYKIAAGSSVATTMAGTGESGYSGDGGPATQATFGVAVGLAIDPKGDLYVSDAIYHVVRKIDLTTGVITTVAGTGTAGHTGDGGPALAAELNEPTLLTFDAAGDLYISENGNLQLEDCRRVSAYDHVISTVVGGGSLFEPQRGSPKDSGSALDVHLFGLGGLAFDPNGDLWIASYDGIARLTAAADPALFEATVTGQTTPPRTYALTNPSALPLSIAAIRLSGANPGDFTQQNNCPAQLPPGASCSIAITFTPTAPGTRTATVEVTDDTIGSPHQISLTGVGSGPAPSTTFSFDPVGTNASFTRQVNVSVPPSAGTNITASLAFGIDFAVSGIACSPSTCSVTISFTPKFPNLRKDALQLKDGNGTIIATQFLSGMGQGSVLVYRGAQSITNLYPPEYQDAGGSVAGAAMDPDGSIYLSDFRLNAVFRWDATTRLFTLIAGTPDIRSNGYAGDGGPAINARLNGPIGLATDPAGNLYIGEVGNHIVRRIDHAFGTISTVAGTGVTGNTGDGGPAIAARLNAPVNLTIDASGNLFIADRDANVVRQVDGQTGIISTVAGTGTADYTGDGGPAISAQLNSPQGVAIGPDGNLYIADRMNYAVRMVDHSTGIISTVLGLATEGSGDNYSSTLIPSHLLSNVATGLCASYIGGWACEMPPAGSYVSTLPPLYPSSGPLLIDGNGTLYDARGVFTIYTGATNPLTFPLTLLGSSAPTQNVIIENAGSTATGPGFLSLTGANAGDFSQSNTCPSGLAPGARCTITVGFQPSHVGALTATISAGNAPPLALNGTGGIGVATPAVSDFSLGTAVVSTPTFTQYLSITNSGSEPLTITGVAITGPNASDFTVNNFAQSGSCQQPIYPRGSYCSIGIIFTPSGTGTRTATLTVTNSGLPSSFTVALSGSGLQPEPLVFVPVTPCRVVDTRVGSNYGPAAPLEGGLAHSFDVTQSNCGIPPDVAAVALNVTAVPLESLGYLTVWPSGGPMPVVSTLNSVEGTTKANAAVVPVTNGSIDVFVSGRSHIILDVTGYFVPAAANGLQFYTLPPCRVADTRNSVGALGGPFLQGGNVRTLPILQSTCNIPNVAQVYSLNITVVPKGRLDYLTVWPSGQTRPGVSTLNAPLGTVTSNAAIAPVGSSGNLDVFVTQDTDLIVDINGYFAPPSTDGLNFYSLPPCRVLDTRLPPRWDPLSGQNFVSVAGICIAPTTAQSYILNATLVTAGPVGYLTLWSDGAPRPNVSTTNAAGPTVVANMAVVPTKYGGIETFLSDPAHLILDIAGYFAP